MYTLVKTHLTALSILFLALATSSTPVCAQDTTKPQITTVKALSGASGFRTWSIGINGGVLAPVAGIGGSNDFTKWMPTLGYGAYIKYQATHVLGSPNYSTMLGVVPSRGTTTSASLSTWDHAYRTLYRL